MHPILLHHLTAAPGWTAVVGAVGTAVSAFVLVVGAGIAQRYVKRASATVEASLFEGPGGLGIHVRPCVRSSSLVRLKLSDEEVPTVAVTEYQLREGVLVVGEPASQDTFTGEKAIDPGETITDSEIFLVTSGPETLGWRVRFRFAVKKWPGRTMWWWAATTFVAGPPPEGLQQSSAASLTPGGDR